MVNKDYQRVEGRAPLTEINCVYLRFNCVHNLLCVFALFCTVLFLLQLLPYEE